MKIGVSSQNFRTITGHAGKGRRFMIFEVGADGNAAEMERLDLPKSMSLHETLPESPHPLDELDVLITQSGGSGFIRKMEVRGVKVVLTSADDPLAAVSAYVAGDKLPPAEPVEDHKHGHGGGHHHPDHAHGHEGGGCCGGGDGDGHGNGHGEPHRRGNGGHGGCGCGH